MNITMTSYISVWFGSLYHYNTGILHGEWIGFPVDEEELNEVYNKYTNDGKHDFFIADYESPFPLDELFTDVFKLNEFAERVENDDTLRCFFDSLDEWQQDMYCDPKKDDLIYSMINVASDYDLQDHTDSFVDDEWIDRHVKNIDGWVSVKIFLSDADSASDSEFQYLNGYENLERLSTTRIKDAVEDLTKDLFDQLV